MALTINPATHAGGKTVEVLGDGATAFDLLTYLVVSNPIMLQGISFYPNAGGATIAVGSETWRSVIRYSEKAKELMELFLTHMGVNREVAPAMVSVSWPGRASWGGGRLNG